MKNDEYQVQVHIADNLCRIADCLETLVGFEDCEEEGMLVSLTHQVTSKLGEIGDCIMHLAERLAR